MPPLVQGLRLQYQEEITSFSQRALVVYRDNEASLNQIRDEAIAKGEAWLAADDFLWHSIYASFGTWQGSKNRTEYMARYPQLTFPVLSQQPAQERQAVIRDLIGQPGICPNMFRRKAKYLADNVGLMEGLIATCNVTGEADLTRILLSSQGRDAKIRFLKKFKGVKDKYARNIMLDVYHPEFTDAAIAIDSRIGGVLQRHRLPTLRDLKYDVLEALLISIAHNMGLIAWEIDRLIYRCASQL